MVASEFVFFTFFEIVKGFLKKCLVFARSIPIRGMDYANFLPIANIIIFSCFVPPRLITSAHAFVDAFHSAHCAQPLLALLPS